MKDIRLRNLLLLIDEAGTVIELAARTGLTRGAIQHYKSGFRNIGDDGAQSLEDGMKKKRGWMDVPHIDKPLALESAIHNKLLYLSPAKLEALAILLGVELSALE
ncbi:hypothetical protein [Ralstonia wenshanensis]|jgi:transcriptional regulator with XRE-family HTH domain|nr:hypothetical protein [Ralstonia wenshanensis]